MQERDPNSRTSWMCGIAPDHWMLLLLPLHVVFMSGNFVAGYINSSFSGKTWFILFINRTARRCTVLAVTRTVDS